ncbi:MAG: helix-hairpin-helix domain-containing protein [Ktedonobacterales bacterium]
MKELQRIPGVGPSLARDLGGLGYQLVADFARQDAEQMYRSLETLRGQPMDPCVLHAFHCAVCFASTYVHDPALLTWWNCKTLPAGQG